MKRKKYNKLIIIGLVGGVASGKSSVAVAFEKRGARVIDADALTHEELDRARSRGKIVKAFGRDVLRKGKVDRAKLSRIVFEDEEQLKILTSIVHPFILAAIGAKLKKLNQRKRPVVVVIEAALLVETGLFKICDHIVYIQCSLKVRLWRARKKRRWTGEELGKREKFQLTLKEKKAVSTATVNNNLTPAYLDRSVEKFWKDNITEALVK